MTLSFAIASETGSTVLVTNDGYMRTALSRINTDSGFACVGIENDDGYYVGTRVVKKLFITSDGRLKSGIDSLLFSEWFPGSTLSSTLWTIPATVMTYSLSDGYITLNSGSDTANNVIRLSSYRSFPVIGSFGLKCDIIASIAFNPVANNITEWGLGIASGTSVPTDGAFFRLASDQTFVCVAVFNSNEIVSSPLSFTNLIGTNNRKHFSIIIGDDSVEYYINNKLICSLLRSTNPAMIASARLPLFFRVYNTGSTSSGQQISISFASVILSDAKICKSWNYITSGRGYHSSQIGTGQTSLYTNNTDGYSNFFVPSNNTEPAGCVGLGGYFYAKIETLATNTDYIIQSYRIPDGYIGQQARTLYITGYSIDTNNQGAINSGSTQLSWNIGLGYGLISEAAGGSTDLNQSETATSKSPRRVAIGSQYLPLSAAIGLNATKKLSMKFQSPIVVQPGERIVTILRFLSYAATTNQGLEFFITYEGYWE